MKSRLLLTLILLILIFSACKKPAQKSSSVNVINDTIYGVGKEAKLEVKNLDFKFLKSTARIFYKDSKDEIKATLQTRIKKDSLIWGSISKSGFEGVRVLIRPDSIFINQRLPDADLSAYSFEELSKKFNFKLNFQIIQAALIGNMPFIKRKDDKFYKDKGYYLMRQNEGLIKIENYVQPDNQKLKKVLLLEQNTNNSISFDYDDFQVLNNFLFPQKSLITLNYKGKEGRNASTLITIEHTKIELPSDPLKFPFKFEKYKRKEEKREKREGKNN